MRRLILGLLLITAALCLCGCSVLLPQENAALQPDLRLLERPVYPDEPETLSSEESEPQALRLDLWLDASQTMGGINANEESMYPHHGVRFREGGFHYRYRNTVGWYDSLLQSMLKAVEGSRVRVLRYGNERLPDEYLIAEGVADETTTADGFRSLRRDMLTYAFDPLPDMLKTLSAEKMEESFYALGSPLLNQMEEHESRLLEDPGSMQAMSEALSDQIDAIEDGRDHRLTAIRSDADYPLLYALDNLDPDRLSVITCDPASIRKLTAVSENGSSSQLVKELLDARGVFDRGHAVGLYAFTLDYMGQISSFGAADLSEPLIWGKPKYQSGEARAEDALPMPRVLLTLVIGSGDHVAQFTYRLNALLAEEPVYKQLRGPEKMELSYASNGETVYQAPFAFDFEYTQITRPVLSSATHHTEGASIVCADGTSDQDTLPVCSSSEKPVITVTVPAQKPEALLTDVTASVADALLLADVIPNTPDVSVPEGMQSLALRDKLYLYGHQQTDAVFRIVGIEPMEDAIAFTLTSDKVLEPGYYRIRLSADYAASAVAWETDPWISEWNTTLSHENISAWESFASLLTEHERGRDNISPVFQHAWGEANSGRYHGTPYPDFPPVYKAPGLSELVGQLQRAADLKQSPCLRFTFDLFVNNR